MREQADFQCAKGKRERRFMMSVYDIVFSPTGGTQRVADIFIRSFCGESSHIDLSDFEKDFSELSFQEEDICIVAVPSFGGRVPAVAASRLGRMQGKGAGAILIAVYGNRDYEDTLVEMQDVLEGAGFSVIAGIAAVAEHSIMRQFASGRPDEQDEKEIAGFAEAVRSKIDSDRGACGLKLPGSRPYREYHVIPMRPQANKDCIQCGLCAGVCPAGAIPKSDPSGTDADKCISCMRCVCVCPQKARSVSKVLLAAGSMKLKKACGGYKRNELFL